MTNNELAKKLKGELKEAEETLTQIENFEREICDRLNDYIKGKFGDKFAALDFNDTPQYTENLIFGDELFFDIFIGKRVTYTFNHFVYERGSFKDDYRKPLVFDNISIYLYFSTDFTQEQIKGILADLKSIVNKFLREK